MSDTQDVEAVEVHWPVALQTRDVAWLREHTTSTFTFISEDGTTMDRETYLSHRGEENDDIVRGANRVDHVEVLGDTAVVLGRSQFLCLNQGRGSYELRFRYSGVYVRSGSTWQAATGQVTAFTGPSVGWGEDLFSAERA